MSQWMFNALAKGPMQAKREQEDGNKQNMLAQLLTQQQIQNQPVYRQGQELLNQQRRTQMQQAGQNKFVIKQGPDGSQYQLEVGPNGQMVGQPRKMGMGQQPRKVPEFLIEHLDPEYQVMDPQQVPTKAWIGAAQRAKVERDKGSPMVQVNERIKAEQLRQQELKTEEAEMKKQKAKELKGRVFDIARDLLSNPNLDKSVGTLQGSALGQALTVDGGSQDFINKHNQLRSILTAGNLELMSGVLSETDIKILAAIAGGGINLNGSENAYKEGLTELLNDDPAGPPKNEDDDIMSQADAVLRGGL